MRFTCEQWKVMFRLIPTELLKYALELDLHRLDEDALDLEVLRAIVEVLTERRPPQDKPRKTAEESLKEFREKQGHY